MRYSEQFMEHIEYAFHAFCKIVLRHEAMNVWREVLLLYYFVGYRDEAIGRLYGRCRGSINRRRNVALKQLRKEWERMEHEE